MVLRPLSKRDKEIKAAVLRGESVTVIARNKRMSRTSVYRVIDELVYRKELYIIPGTVSPRCYVDLNPDNGQTSKNETNGPTVTKNGPLPSDVSGISFAEKCPEGDEWWAAHMTSGIKFTVACEGNYADPCGKDGCCFAYWNAEEPTRMKGCRVRTGGMRMHGQDVTWQVRIGLRNHKLVFFFYPGQIWHDITKFPTEDLLVPIFKDRALQFAELMNADGWRLTNPIVKGTIHKAKPGHRAISHFDKDAKQFSQPDLVVDTSHGQPELEFENLRDDPLASEKQELMAFLPSRILAAESKIDGHTVCINQMMGRLDSTLVLLDKLVDGQEKLSILEAIQFDSKVMKLDEPTAEDPIKPQSESTAYPMEGYF